MEYKRCPRCGLNYIKEDETLCDVCKNELNPNAKADNFMKNVKRGDVIKLGDVFPFSQNYQLINFLTGSNLKKCGRATYRLTNSCYIWMVALDGKQRDGWVDTMLKDGTIKQKFVGNKSDLPSNFGLTFNYEYRAVFEKTGDSYIFRGVYKMDLENTSLFERFYTKVSDTTTLYDY